MSEGCKYRHYIPTSNTKTLVSLFLSSRAITKGWRIHTDLSADFFNPVFFWGVFLSFHANHKSQIASGCKLWSPNRSDFPANQSEIRFKPQIIRIPLQITSRIAILMSVHQVTTLSSSQVIVRTISNRNQNRVISSTKRRRRTIVA